MITFAQTASVEEDTSFLGKLTGTFREMFNNLIDGLPNICLGLIILIVGAVIATFLKKIIIKALEGIKFDEILDKVGIGSVFIKLGVKNGVIELIGKLIFWVIMLFIIKNAADQVGIEDISTIIDNLIAFLPKIIIATLIMLVGFMVADIIRNAVFAVLDKLGLDYAKALAGIIFGFVIVIVSCGLFRWHVSVTGVLCFDESLCGRVFWRWARGF